MKVYKIVYGVYCRRIEGVCMMYAGCIKVNRECIEGVYSVY